MDLCLKLEDSDIHHSQKGRYLNQKDLDLDRGSAGHLPSLGFKLPNR